MKWLVKFFNLLLYGNFWIAGCALALSLQTRLLLTGELGWGIYESFLFAGTVCLYALHRLVGLRRLRPFQQSGRLRVIARFRKHILAYTILSGLIGAYFFLQLERRVQWSLILPALLAFSYVLPVFGRQRRLRDLPDLKIFLIALVWGLVTVISPAVRMETARQPAVWWMLLERALFIFAICLPFDIRDLRIDAYHEVPTLPARLGIRGAKRLAALVLAGMMACVGANLWLHTYTPAQAIAFLFSGGTTLIFIGYSDRFQHDYYFSGLMDGAMILQFLLVAALTFYLS